MGFSFLTSPGIVFGPGALEELPSLTRGMGSRALLVMGQASPHNVLLEQKIRALVPVGAVARCQREPTDAEVDRAVALARDASCDMVLAAGGGAVMDCGKAASAMITNGGPLRDYLEGVGTGRAVDLPPAPMVAIPTTSGTGSEVTKNAVISGPGYKKSIRSPLMIPRLALVDPLLTHSMPPAVTASCGMDALVQLVESYLSRNASPLTDGLCLQGISAAGRFLRRAYLDPDDAEAREGMSLASLLGGICLANAGLGAVHGFASPLGALFPIPHGVACAALFPQVLQANLDAARGAACFERVHGRLAGVGRHLCGVQHGDPAEAAAAGLERIRDLQRALKIPRLGELGVTRGDFPALVAGSRGSSMRYNPVDLDDDQLTGVLEAAL